MRRSPLPASGATRGGRRRNSARASMALPALDPSMASHPAELEPGRVRHPARVPGRIPDDIDLHFLDSGDALDLAPDVLLEHVAHSAARRGHGHRDLDPVAA